MSDELRRSAEDASRGQDAESGKRGTWVRVRARLPELLIEATFIFLAVLLALFAEEWRERRDRRELADRALTGIVAEISSNRDELLDREEENRAQLEELRGVVEGLRAGKQLSEMSVDYQVALTSSAAWETARMSQAVHFMDLEIVTRLAEMYELQRLFERAQDDLVDGMVAIGTQARDEPLLAAEEAYGRINSVLGYRGILVQVYDSMLARMDPGASP